MFTLTYTAKLIKWDENMATISTDALKFGKTVVKSPEWTMIPMALILGVICGLLGAFIVFINAKIAICRKNFIKRKPIKVFEAVFFSLITTTAFYWLPHYIMECKSADAENLKPEYKHLIVRGYCNEGEYNSMASLLYNTEADAIKAIMSGWAAPKGITLTLPHMLAYLALWYFFTCTTYGVYVPAGTFLPAIIIGCAVGTIYEDIYTRIFVDDIKRDEEYFDRAVVPVLVAVGGILSA